MNIYYDPASYDMISVGDVYWSGEKHVDRGYDITAVWKGSDGTYYWCSEKDNGPEHEFWNITADDLSSGTKDELMAYLEQRKKDESASHESMRWDPVDPPYLPPDDYVEMIDRLRGKKSVPDSHGDRDHKVDPVRDRLARKAHSYGVLAEVSVALQHRIKGIDVSLISKISPVYEAAILDQMKSVYVKACNLIEEGFDADHVVAAADLSIVEIDETGTRAAWHVVKSLIRQSDKVGLYI